MAQSGYYTRLSSAMGPPRRRYRGEMLVSAAAAGNLKARVITRVSQSDGQPEAQRCLQWGRRAGARRGR
jgi:hypothetical protein